MEKPPANRSQILILIMLCFLFILVLTLGKHAKNTPEISTAQSTESATPASPKPKPPEEVYVYFLWGVGEGYVPTPLEGWLKVLVGPEGRYNIPKTLNDCGESERGEGVDTPTCLEIEVWMAPRNFTPEEKKKLMEFPSIKTFMYVSFIKYQGKKKNFEVLSQLPDLISSLGPEASQVDMVDIFVVVVPGPQVDKTGLIRWMQRLAGETGKVSELERDCKADEADEAGSDRFIFTCLEISVSMIPRDFTPVEKKKWSEFFYLDDYMRVSFLKYQDKKKKFRLLSELPDLISSLGPEASQEDMVDIFVVVVPGPQVDKKVPIQWMQTLVGEKGEVIASETDCKADASEPDHFIPTCLEISASMVPRDLTWSQEKEKWHPVPKVYFDSGWVMYRGKTYPIKYLDNIPKIISSFVPNSLISPPSVVEKPPLKKAEFYMDYQYRTEAEHEALLAWLEEMVIHKSYLIWNTEDCEPSEQPEGEPPSTCVRLFGGVRPLWWIPSHLRKLQEVPPDITLKSGLLKYKGIKHRFQNIEDLPGIVWTLVPPGEAYIFVKYFYETEAEQEAVIAWFEKLIIDKDYINWGVRDCRESELKEGEPKPTCVTLSAWMPPRDLTSSSELKKLSPIPDLAVDFGQVSYKNYLKKRPADPEKLKELLNKKQKRFKHLKDIPDIISSLNP